MPNSNKMPTWCEWTLGNKTMGCCWVATLASAHSRKTPGTTNGRERIFGTAHFSGLTTERHFADEQRLRRRMLVENFWWNVKLSMIPKSKSGFPPIFAFVTQIPFFHPQRSETGGRIIPFKVAGSDEFEDEAVFIFRSKERKDGKRKSEIISG